MDTVIGVSIKVIYGTPGEVRALLGGHTPYVERTHLTSQQMNRQLVQKPPSFSQEVKMLEATWTWEDWIYNLTRPGRALRIEVNDDRRWWQPCSPAMAAADLTDHIWTAKELLMRVVTPNVIDTNQGDYLTLRVTEKPKTLRLRIT